MNPLAESELILNPDGSVYHLHLKPEDIADTIILVGDQHRVERISRHFDATDFKMASREFVTHTGTVNGQRITALSTGIGTDNIDIVINELDAAVNIDLETRLAKPEKRSLKLIRLGTSGSLQEDIPVDSSVLSTHGLGLDGLMYFYENQSEIDQELTSAFINNTNYPSELPKPYIVPASTSLLERIW